MNINITQFPKGENTLQWSKIVGIKVIFWNFMCLNFHQNFIIERVFCKLYLE
jgi:hypothetical protein